MSQSAARRLARLAAPLKPERDPYYMRLPVGPGLEQTFPAPGWYWVPPGHNMAVYLAASVEVAAIALHQLHQETPGQ